MSSDIKGKGKGSRLELGNNRYIHLKDWLPRTCDALIVDNMKPDILESSSIFQIGGQAGHITHCEECGCPHAAAGLGHYLTGV